MEEGDDVFSIKCFKYGFPLAFVLSSNSAVLPSAPRPEVSYTFSEGPKRTKGFFIHFSRGDEKGGMSGGEEDNVWHTCSSSSLFTSIYNTHPGCVKGVIGFCHEVMDA